MPKTVSGRWKPKGSVSGRTHAYPHKRKHRKTKRKSAKQRGNYVTQSFTVLAATITVPQGTTFQEEFSPSLSNIEAGDLAAYQALYDQFRVTSITIDVQPNVVVNTNSGGAGTTGDVFPIRMYSVIDKTDLNAITVGQAMQYNNCVKRLSTHPHPIYRRYVPEVPVMLQDVNANYMLQIERSPWLQLNPQVIGGNNFDNTIVAFPAVKCISDTNNGDTLVFDVYITFVVDFKTKN